MRRVGHMEFHGLNMHGGLNGDYFTLGKQL